MQHHRTIKGLVTDLLPPVLIGFAGVAGAGKSTAARHLKDEHGYTRLRFAGPLKAMIRALLEEQGVGMARAIQMTDGHLKEAPTSYLGGRSPRHAMQTLGTEWGRTHLGAEFWVSAWVEMVKTAQLHALPDRALIVVDDVRFANEVAAIRALGGRVYRIDRPGLAATGGHASETQALDVDRVIENDGSEDDLRRAIDLLMMRK